MNSQFYLSGIGQILKRNLFSFHSLKSGFSTKSSIQSFDQVVDSFVEVVAGTRNGYRRSFELKMSFGGKLVFVR